MIHDLHNDIIGQYGHFSCQENQFFYGLSGLYCFNCGQEGHHGAECDRPNYDACSKDIEVATKEIERAESLSMYVSCVHIYT